MTTLDYKELVYLQKAVIQDARQYQVLDYKGDITIFLRNLEQKLFQMRAECFVQQTEESTK